jgi:hypothetical protein
LQPPQFGEDRLQILHPDTSKDSPTAIIADFAGGGRDGRPADGAAGTDLKKGGSSTRQMESGGSEYSSRPGMAENLDFPEARMDENPTCQVFAKSLGHGFDHQAHGGHKAHGQGRVRTEAAIGGGRKASLYAALGMCHTIVHEPDGACPSIRHHRKSSTGVLANSTSNVEEPQTNAPACESLLQPTGVRRYHTRTMSAEALASKGVRP